MLKRLPTIAELNSGSVAAVSVDFTELPKLNHRQLQFVDEYMKCGNAKAAAIRVGYASPPSSPDIEMHILWHRAKIRDAYDISKPSLLRELGKIIGANLDDFLITNELTGEKQWDFSMVQRDQMAAIAEYSTEETRYGRKIKVKLADKLSAIEKVAKLLGYNEPDRVQAVNFNATVSADMSPQDAAEAYRRMREGGG